MGAPPGRPHRSPRKGSVRRRVDKRNGHVYFQGRAMVRRRLYQVEVYVVGKRTEASVEAECWRRLRKKIDDVLDGTALVDQSRDRLFSTQAAAWLAEQRLSLRERSYDNYERMLNLHALPALGQKMLGEITRADIVGLLEAKRRPGADWVDRGGKRRKAKAMAQAGLELLHTVLMKCLREAAEEGRPIDPNVLKVKLKGQAAEQGAKPVLAPADAGRVFDSMRARGDRYHALWVLNFYTGCRLGELLGLRRSRVDLNRRVIQIVEKLPPRPDADAPGWEPTKTGVLVEKPLCDEAVEALELRLALREVEKATAGDRWTEHDLVFCREDGAPETQARARSQWKIALREAGLSYFAPRNLRHSFATGTLVATSDLHSTSKLLGHRRLATTDASYIQPVTPLQREAVRKLQEAVRGPQAVARP